MHKIGLLAAVLVGLILGAGPAAADALTVEQVCPEATGRVLEVPSRYHTIQEAVENAEDGDKILVRPGTYGGGIVIDKGVILESEGGSSVTEIVSTADQKGIVVLRTAGTVIRGFAISGGKVGVSLEAISQFCMEQNEISNNVGSGIEIVGRSVELGREAEGITIADNLIADNVGYGISASDLQRAEIFGNEISDIAAKPDGTAGLGISVLGGQRVEIRGNKVSSTKGTGISAGNITELEITGNEVRELPTGPGPMPAAAIEIGSGTIGGFVTDNLISESEIGIEVDGVKSLTLRDNVVSQSKVAGIHISDSLLVRLEDNRILNTQPEESFGSQLAIGIEVLNDSTVTIVGTEVRHSFGYGVWIRDGAEVEIAESTIAETTGRPGIPGHGLGIKDALLEIRDSVIEENTDDGLVVLAGGKAQLEGNIIRGNGDFGIFADPRGSVNCPATNSLSGNGTDISENVPSSCVGGKEVPWICDYAGGDKTVDGADLIGAIQDYARGELDGAQLIQIIQYYATGTPCDRPLSGAAVICLG